MSISNKDYLNKLIAKAKKSWEGVDVDSYMSDLRDDSFDKEVSENLSKEVASYITEQMKSNMDKVTIRCRDLMVGDWCCNKRGFPMQITNVGEDYAYATWEDNEGDPWEYDDKDDQPEPIPITPEILEKNGFSPETFLTAEWEKEVYFKEFSSCVVETDDSGKYIFGTTIYWNKIDGDGSPIDWGTMYDSRIHNLQYVHELQHALRLCGLNELADNFKVYEK